MKKKNYKGSRCEKRTLSKCSDGVVKTFNDIESRYADKLELGEYCSDFVAVKVDGDLLVRECVYRKHLTKPLTAKLLDASREYWGKRGVLDWGIVVEEVNGEKSTD